MNKLFFPLALLMLAAACGGAGRGNQRASSPAAVAAADAAAGQEPDSLFFPAPDAERALYPPAPFEGYDSRDYPTYFAFVGRFASYDELRRSPFYGLLCQRIPALARARGFAVDNSKGLDDVWMLVPTVAHVECEVMEFKLEAGPKTYFRTEDLKPILIHTPMGGNGSVVVNLYADERTGRDFGKHRGASYVLRHDSWNGLDCHTVETELGTPGFSPRIPSAPGFDVMEIGDWMVGDDGHTALKFLTNGQLLVRRGKGRPVSCSYLVYKHQGRDLIAVKSDDGKRRAVWEWDKMGGGDPLVARQIKGDVLPDNKQHEYLSEDLPDENQ